MVENILWFLVFGALFFFMMRKGGCGMHVHGGHQHNVGEHGPRDETRDPVCGMTLRAESSAGTSEHDGRTFYFCSTDCHRTFLSEPGRYSDSG